MLCTWIAVERVSGILARSYVSLQIECSIPLYEYGTGLSQSGHCYPSRVDSIPRFSVLVRMVLRLHPGMSDGLP